MKVAGYVRVSTPFQAKKGESLKTQETEIKKFAKDKGWDLVKIYKDEGLSGSKAESRPGFMKMINDSSRDKFEGIIFSRLSRFARNAGDFLHFNDRLKDNGVSLISIKEGIDPTNKTGKLMMGLLALIAEWERETIREQMSENKMARWKDYRTFLGKPPFGYVWNKEKKKLEINEDEAETYKRVVDMYCNLGVSFKDIALKLREESIKCKKAYFSSTTISYMLKNPAYYGNYVLNKTEYEYNPNSGRHRRTKKPKPASEHITFPIPPIISKTEWDKIQKKTSFNRVKSKRSTYVQNEYWLRDLLICKECGGKIKPHHGGKRKDGTFPRYYSCYWADASKKTLTLANKKRCKTPLIRAKSIETEVWKNLFSRFLIYPQFREEFVPLIDKVKYDSEEKALDDKLKRLNKELKKKQNARKRLYDAFEDDGFDKNELGQRLNKNQNEILEIEAHLSEAQQRLENIKMAKENDHLLKDFLNNKPDVLKKIAKDIWALSAEDKKKVAESMIDEKVKVDWYLEEWGKKVEQPHFDSTFNLSILNDLMSQNKILLSKDSTDHFC